MKSIAKSIWIVVLLLLAPCALAADRYPARTISFPEKFSFGDVYIVTNFASCNNWCKSKSRQRFSEARGAVSVPAGSMVKLNVLYDGGLNVAPLAKLKADDIQSLDLTRVEVHKDTGSYLTHLTGLMEISASDTEAGDDFVHCLLPLRNLECLILNRTPISDKGLEDVSKLQNLTILSLAKDALTDRGIVNLAKLQSLKSLRLESSNLSDVGLKSLESLQNLTCLTINDTKITDAGLASIAKLHALSYLEIAHTGVHGQGLKYLGKLQNLACIKISSNTVAPYCVASLKRMLPNCRFAPDDKSHSAEMVPDLKD